MSMTKAERTELKSVVRNQFKVLKSEVNQRREEMAAEIKHQVDERFREEDAKRENTVFLIDQLILECNRAINNVLYEQGYQVKSGSEHVWIHSPRPPFDEKDKNRLTWTAQADLNAKVAAAAVTLQRQEADLLRQLAVDAIETDDARSFLNTIPSVAELVPATRLVELEAAMKDPT